MSKQIVNTSLAPAPIGPYNQSVKAGGFLFISGQVAINPLTGNVDATSIEEETHQVMKNLSAILTEVKIDFSAGTSINLNNNYYLAIGLSTRTKLIGRD